ncbi:MAG: hypothetical protein ISS18_15620, partial [Bacteroidales bacterium]|nr:hypothetical protein [Bacteroidales bacterium]
MKKIFFSLVFLIPFLLFSQHEIDDDLDVYGNIKSRVMGKKVQASVGHFDQIQLLGVFLDTNSIPPVIEVNGGGLLIVDPNYKFSINGSDVWRNIYDPFAYGADNTGASDATGYFNSKCPGGDCGDVFYPAKGTYRIDGTVNFPSNSVLKMDPETMLDGYGTLHGDSTYIDAGRYQIFSVNLTITGIWLVINPFPEWFGLSAYGDYAPGFLAKIDSLRHTDEWINFYHNPYFQGNLAVKDSIGIG